MASPTSRPAAVWWPTPSLPWSTRRPATRPRLWSVPSRSPGADRCGSEKLMQLAVTPTKASQFRYTFSAMSAALLVLFGYVLGSVPTGLLVGRAFGVDVRNVGSGNIGMANVLRAAGKWPAALTMFGDMLKGLIPVVVAR